jgi:competence protein ComEC
MFGGLYYLRVSRVALITISCLSFLGGIGLSAVWQLSAPALVASAGLLVFCRTRRAVVAVPIALAVGLFLGLWRGSNIQALLAGYHTVIGRKVSVQGVVAEDPTYGGDHQQDMILQHVRINVHELPGQIRVKSLAPVEPQRGDTVIADGKLYDGFGSYQASLYYADLHVVGTQQDPINAARHWFAARVHSLLPDTEAGLGLGFVVGIKSELPDDLNNQLKLLGLTHIVVASGYNLTVLVRLARRLFAKRSHYQMTMVALGLIGGFVLVTGFSPSMSRAALVSGLSVWAWYYGRRVHPALLICLAAAITAAVNPLYVWGDLGWWLSFLSFGGVMLLAPLLQRRIFNQKQPKLIGQVVLETVCAQIVTLPLMVLIFGNISVLSLVANVLVVPLIPLAMLLTTLCVVISPIGWPAMWLLGYICQLVQLLAQVSWASIPLTITPVIMLCVYGAIAGCGLLLLLRTKHDYLRQSVIE